MAASEIVRCCCGSYPRELTNYWLSSFLAFAITGIGVWSGLELQKEMDIYSSVGRGVPLLLLSTFTFFSLSLSTLLLYCLTFLYNESPF